MIENPYQFTREEWLDTQSIEKPPEKYRPGDHVLFWGVMAKIFLAHGGGLFQIEEWETERGHARTDHWVRIEKLEAHQRPWRFDKALDGWVPE